MRMNQILFFVSLFFVRDCDQTTTTPCHQDFTRIERLSIKILFEWLYSSSSVPRNVTVPLFFGCRLTHASLTAWSLLVLRDFSQPAFNIEKVPLEMCLSFVSDSACVYTVCVQSICVCKRKKERKRISYNQASRAQRFLNLLSDFLPFFGDGLVMGVSFLLFSTLHFQQNIIQHTRKDELSCRSERE